MILSLLASTAVLFSASAQEATLPTIDAQSLAMGGVTMTNVNSSHSLFNNAALTAFSLLPAKISTSYYGQADFDYYGISGYWRFDQRNTLQAGWRQYHREKGNHDSALDLAYVRRLNENWSIGITGRYTHLKRYEEAADALAADLSVAWAKPLSWERYTTLRAGAKLSNLGGYLDDAGLDLPIDFTVGAALDTYFSDAHQLTVGADLGYCFTPDAVRGFQASVGAEYALMQLVRLRAGYHYGEKESYYPSYGSVGAGISILHIRVDFAYLIADKETSLHDTYSISFGLDF